MNVSTLKVFVTGGSGFVGRNLVEYLQPRYHVLAPRHAELDLLNEDDVRSFLRRYRPDVVVHSAVKPGHRNAKDFSGLIHANSRMFFNIARNAGDFRKMIYLSSGAVYDMRYYQPKMQEDYFDDHVPVDDTGYPKYLCAKYIEKTDNIVELRPFGVFGKYEDWEIRFISNAICKNILDIPISIKQNRRFDYIYVDDLVRVIDYFILNDGAHRVYNVTPDDAVELLDLAKKVMAVSGKELDIRIAQPGLGAEYSGDNTRLREEMASLELTAIDSAIGNLYEWYSSHRGEIKREALLVDK